MKSIGKLLKCLFPSFISNLQKLYDLKNEIVSLKIAYRATGTSKKTNQLMEIHNSFVTEFNSKRYFFMSPEKYIS